MRNRASVCVLFVLCYALCDPLQSFWASKAMLQLARLEFRCNLQLCRPRLPLQLDSWSCGHRCVVAWQWALQSELSEVPASLFTDEAIKGVCQEKAAQTPAKRKLQGQEDDWTPQPKRPKLTVTGAECTGPPQQQAPASRAGCQASGSKVATQKADHPEFQRDHWRQKVPAPRKHWAHFLSQLEKPFVSWTCKACRILKQNLSPAAENSTEAVIPVSDSEDEQPQQPKPEKKGSASVRPARSIEDWMSEHRPCLYLLKGPTILWCVACQVEVPVHRRSESAKKFVISHEKSARHQRCAEAKKGEPGQALGKQPAALFN